MVAAAGSAYLYGGFPFCRLRFGYGYWGRCYGCGRWYGGYGCCSSYRHGGRNATRGRWWGYFLEWCSTFADSWHGSEVSGFWDGDGTSSRCRWWGTSTTEHLDWDFITRRWWWWDRFGLLLQKVLVESLTEMSDHLCDTVRLDYRGLRRRGGVEVINDLLLGRCHALRCQTGRGLCRHRVVPHALLALLGQAVEFGH